MYYWTKPCMQKAALACVIFVLYSSTALAACDSFIDELRQLYGHVDRADAGLRSAEYGSNEYRRYVEQIVTAKEQIRDVKFRLGACKHRENYVRDRGYRIRRKVNPGKSTMPRPNDGGS